MLFSTKIPAYLIDSENVGSTWASLLQTDEKFDLYIFVTENAKNLNFSLLKDLTGENAHKLNIIECQTGKNSLDFYLSSYLGYLIGKNNHSSYVVVAQDTGYDGVIDYWNSLGHKVQRINTKPLTANKTRKAKVPAKKKPVNTNSEVRVISAKENNQPKKKKADQPKKTNNALQFSDRNELLRQQLPDLSDEQRQQVRELLDKVPADKHADKSYIYREIIRKFKSDKGLLIYTALKKELDKYYQAA